MEVVKASVEVAFPYPYSVSFKIKIKISCWFCHFPMLVGASLMLKPTILSSMHMGELVNGAGA